MEIWLSGLAFELIPAAFFCCKPITIHAHFALYLVNIDGELDTAYAYGNERLTVERFTGWTGYYTYDSRGSVSGVTDADGDLWASYRYNATGKMTFGEPEYNQIYGYNGESYNPMLELQYLRARYYDVERGNFLTEDTYLGDISDPLTLNRYNYVVSNPLNYTDPSGHENLSGDEILDMFGGAEGRTKFDIPVLEDFLNYVGATISEAAGKAVDKVLSQFTDTLKSAMNAAQKACRSLDCEVSTALYNIGLGVAYSLFDNVVLQTDGILWELFGRDSREWNDVEEFFENWVIENGVTDTSYFYLGQLTGDVLQTVYVIKNLPKLISKAGNKLAGLMAGGGSYGLAMAGAGAGGTAGSIAAEALVEAVGATGAAVIAAMADVTGLGHDGGKFIESITKGDSNSYKAPEGGGGVTDKIKIGDTEVSFGHGGRHLEGTNLSPAEVNQAIANDVVSKHSGTGQFYKGRININGTEIEYTSFGVKDGLINVGTYYPVQ